MPRPSTAGGYTGPAEPFHAHMCACIHSSTLNDVANILVQGIVASAALSLKAMGKHMLQGHPPTARWGNSTGLKHMAHSLVKLPELFFPNYKLLHEARYR